MWPTNEKLFGSGCYIWDEWPYVKYETSYRQGVSQWTSTRLSFQNLVEFFQLQETQQIRENLFNDEVIASRIETIKLSVCLPQMYTKALYTQCIPRVLQEKTHRHLKWESTDSLIQKPTHELCKQLLLSAISSHLLCCHNLPLMPKVVININFHFTKSAPTTTLVAQR